MLKKTQPDLENSSKKKMAESFPEPSENHHSHPNASEAIPEPSARFSDGSVMDSDAFGWLWDEFMFFWFFGQCVFFSNFCSGDVSCSACHFGPHEISLLAFSSR